MSDMYQECLKQMTKALDNWPKADVRIVPGVMYQIRCGIDENDPNIEYQINWFMDCTETYIHNHAHSFHTLCLEGGYEERLWEIFDDGTGAVIHRFYRKPGNIIDAPEVIPGVLRSEKSRLHFPGNLMHTATNQFHSITPSSSVDRTFTFLRKEKDSKLPGTYILSASPTIDAPSDKIISATPDQRQEMYQQLVHILETKFSPMNSIS